MSEHLMIWSRWSDLNRRPTLYERVALPLSYIGLKYIYESLELTLSKIQTIE